MLETQVVPAMLEIRVTAATSIAIPMLLSASHQTYLGEVPARYGHVPVAEMTPSEQAEHIASERAAAPLHCAMGLDH